MGIQHADGPDPSAQPMRFRLYVAGESPRSARAIQNLKHLVDSRLMGACEVEVVDVLTSPERAERERIASGLRAEGDQRDLEIRAEVDRQVQITLQTAEGQAALLRGEGEREAILILAQALEQDPEFYDFQRTLQAYRTALDDGHTTVVLDPNSDFFKFLQDPFGDVAPPATPTPAPAP